MRIIHRSAVMLVAVIFLSLSVYADVTVKVRTTVGDSQFTGTTLIKGQRERTEQDYGGMKVVSIKQCDLKRTIKLNPSTEMYVIEKWATDPSLTETVSTSKDSRNPQESTTTVTRKGGVVTVTISMRDTGERKKMFGYTARHLIFTIEMQSSADSCGGADYSKMETDGWYIDAAFGLECENIFPVDIPEPSRQMDRTECKDRQVVKTSGGTMENKGYPVYEKTTMFDKSGKPSFTSVKEVLELSMVTLDPALFDVPKGWTLVSSENEMMMGANMLDPKVFAGANKRDQDDEDSDQDDAQESSAGSATGTKGSGGSGQVGGIVKSSSAGPKKPGTVRIGLAGVKTGSVGDGLSPELLANAVHKLFGDYFKGTGIELVFIEAKLQSAMENEARGSACDFLLMATVSHKRGGGGFGALRSIGSAIGRNIPYGGSVAEQVGSEVAREAIYDASEAAAGIKSKDELTLDINLKKLDGSSALTRQFKSKASSEQEDIMSPAVEKATEAILGFVSK